MAVAAKVERAVIKIAAAAGCPNAFWKSFFEPVNQPKVVLAMSARGTTYSHRNINEAVLNTRFLDIELMMTVVVANVIQRM